MSSQPEASTQKENIDDMSRLITNINDNLDGDMLLSNEDMIPLTLEEVDMLMDSFSSQNESTNTSESQQDTQGPQTPESLQQEKMPSESMKSIPSETPKPPVAFWYSDNAHYTAMLKAISDKSDIPLDNDGPLKNINLKALILETAKSWKNEDKQKIALLLPSEYAGERKMDGDFFSDKNTRFWNQIKLFEKRIASTGFSKIENGRICKMNPKKKVNSMFAPHRDKFKDENFETYWGERLRRNGIERKKDDKK